MSLPKTDTVAVALADVRPKRAKGGRAWGAFKQALRSPAGLAGFVVVIVMIALGLLAPWISPASPVATAFDSLLKPPSAENLLGTDELGRDQLSRVLHGILVSVQIGLGSVVLAAIIGVPIGLIAGYYHRADAVISRFVDVLLAFPNLILAVGLAAILGPSATNATIALAVGAIPGFVRIVRGEVFRLRGLEFVYSAVAAGASDLRILFSHILPNATSVLLVQVTVSIPAAVLGEAMLSFLGLGIRPPDPSLGTMLSNAQPYLQSAWWLAVFPGAAIIAITLAFNLFGDALRDALDPRGRRR
jgi:peptide/nickel transport system permease protein